MTPRRPLTHSMLDGEPCTPPTQPPVDLRLARGLVEKDRSRRQRPVLYKSSALAATAPNLTFQRYDSAHIAAAAAEADDVREKFKAEQLEAAGVAEVEGESEEAACAKKYVRRLLLNRHSAAASRLRKEAYVSALEKQLSALEREYTRLLGQYSFERKQAFTTDTMMNAPPVIKLAGEVSATDASEAYSDDDEQGPTNLSTPVHRCTSAPQHGTDCGVFWNDADANVMLPLSELDMPPFFKLE